MSHDPFKPRKSTNPAGDILKVGIAVKAASDLSSISKNMEELAQAERIRASNEFFERREREVREKQDREQHQAHQVELERIAKQTQQETLRVLQDQEVAKEKEQRMAAIQTIQDKGLGIDVEHFSLVQEIALTTQLTLEQAAKAFREELVDKSWGFALKKEFQPHEQTKDAIIARYPQVLSLDIDLDALAKRTLRYAHKLDKESFVVPSLEQKLKEAEDLRRRLADKELHEQELRAQVRDDLSQAKELYEQHMKELKEFDIYWRKQDEAIAIHNKKKPALYDWRYTLIGFVGAAVFPFSMIFLLARWSNSNAFLPLVIATGLSGVILFGLRHLINPKRWAPIEKLVSSSDWKSGSDIQFATTVQPKDKSLYPLRLEAAAKVDSRKCYRLLVGEVDDALYRNALAVMGLKSLTLAQMSAVPFEVMREKLSEKHLGNQEGLRFWLQIHEKEDELLLMKQAEESQKGA